MLGEQAIPKSELCVAGGSLHLRAAFLASPGFLFLAADYEQIEFRVLAHLSGDPNLIREGEIFCLLYYFAVMFVGYIVSLFVVNISVMLVK